jgi:putative ABC transport system permease protein
MGLATDVLVDVGDGQHRLLLGAVVVVLGGLAVLVNLAGSLGHAHAVVRACGRAVLQLLVVSLVIAAVLDSRRLTMTFITVMLAVASLTAARRLTRRRDGAWAVVPVVVAVAPACGLIFGAGLVPLTGVVVVPITGILIGGAMTATVVAGQRALDALNRRRGEHEAAMSLGLTSRDAALLVCRDDAALALVPGLDQTRTVGLVTLPGAFVGMLLGGAGPLAAGAVQLLVLVALLLVQSTSVWLTVELVASNRIRRTDVCDRPRLGR